MAAFSLSTPLSCSHFLAETSLPSCPSPSSLWGVSESAEPRVRMFHHVTQKINVLLGGFQLGDSLLECGRQEVKDRWLETLKVHSLISLNHHGSIFFKLTLAEFVALPKLEFQKSQPTLQFPSGKFCVFQHMVLVLCPKHEQPTGEASGELSSRYFFRINAGIQKRTMQSY